MDVLPIPLTPTRAICVKRSAKRTILSIPTALQLVVMNVGSGDADGCSVIPNMMTNVGNNGVLSRSTSVNVSLKAEG